MRSLVLFLALTCVAYATTKIKDNNLKLGKKDNQDVFIYADNGDANPPYLFYDYSDSKWKQSSDGLTDLDLALGDNPVLSGNESVTLPSGTTAERPGAPVAGMLRYNSDEAAFEGYTTEWGALASGGGTATVLNNMLEDPSFEESLIEGTVTTSGSDTSAVASRTVEAGAFNLLKLNLAASGNATLDYTYTKTANFEGQQLYAYCEIKTANTNVTFNSMLNGAVDSTLDVVSDDKWRYYRIPLVGGATSQGFKIDHTNASETPDIDVDNCFIGKTQDASFKIDTTISDWKEFDPIVKGFISDPSFGSTSVKIAYYRRVGDSLELRVEIQQTSAGSAGSDNYYFQLPNGLTADTSKIQASATTGLGTVGSASARVAGSNYEGTASVINANGVSVYIGNATTNPSYVGSSFLSLSNSEWRLSFEATVPIVGWSSEKSTVVTQQTELTAETANTLSFSMNDTGIVSNENYDFVNGNCIRTNQSLYYRYDCPLNDIGLTEKMTCVVSSIQGAGLYLVAQDKNGSSTTNLQFTSQFSNGNSILAGAMDVVCSKSNADVNKSATIVGKFENINSSDLCKVIANGNDGEAITASSEDLPFKTTLEDNCGAWSNGGNTGSNTNDQYTAQKNGFVLITGQAFATGDVVSWSIRVHKNGNPDTYCGRDTNDDTVAFACQLKVNVGDTLTFRSSDAVTLNSGNAELHRIEITELPDTESIVKNLSNQKTKCQTKFLTGNLTGNSLDNADVRFTGLTVGKKYRVLSQLFSNATDAGAAAIKNNNVTVCQQRNASPSLSLMTNATCEFTAAGTTLNTDYLISGTGTIFGTSPFAAGWTHIRLCQLPDTFVETAEW